jgi:hypothetical protein
MSETIHVLVLGQDVNTVDFSNPALPPGMTAAAVTAGLEQARASLVAQGFEVDMLQVLPDPAVAEAAIAARLAGRTYGVVVIGAGIRNPPPSLFLFETVLNAVHRGAPGARIAFNTRPDDSDVAAVRWAHR